MCVCACVYVTWYALVSSCACSQLKMFLHFRRHCRWLLLCLLLLLLNLLIAVKAKFQYYNHHRRSFLCLFPTCFLSFRSSRLLLACPLSLSLPLCLFFLLLLRYCCIIWKYEAGKNSEWVSSKSRERENERQKGRKIKRNNKKMQLSKLCKCKTQKASE